MQLLKQIPQAALTYNPETQLFGFSVWMPGRRPHNVMSGFSARESALQWLDPWKERTWEEPTGSDGTVLAISRGFKPDSAPARLMAR